MRADFFYWDRLYLGLILSGSVFTGGTGWSVLHVQHSYKNTTYRYQHRCFCQYSMVFTSSCTSNFIFSTIFCLYKKRNYTMIHLLRYLQSKNTKTLFLTSCSSGPSLVTKCVAISKSDLISSFVTPLTADCWSSAHWSSAHWSSAQWSTADRSSADWSIADISDSAKNFLFQSRSASRDDFSDF